ncbi:MAG TPA: GNAT family N-acetyltransferase [Steroidobacteraceae bacterium]|nr:GNAT family N-acetyltransferase [Steroidobacteraceae bacterium]
MDRASPAHPERSFEICAAARADLPDLLHIYNEVIRSSTAVFSELEVTLADREAWLEAKHGLGYPVLVARDASSVLGFATFGDFRAWPGYRYTVEHSVHVDAAHRGRGIGTALVSALLKDAAKLGKHAMIAGIDADNTGSIRMHERLGFREAGHFREVGFKFGRWLDLKFLQRLI